MKLFWQVGTINNENLNHDYSMAYDILAKEREKSDDFLRKSLGIKEKDNEK